LLSVDERPKSMEEVCRKGAHGGVKQGGVRRGDSD